MRRVAVGWLLVAFSAAPAGAQTPTSAPAWKPFSELSFLLGAWSGTASRGDRIGGRMDRFALELAGSYLVHRASTVFPAEEGKPEESMEEVGYFTYDREKRRYVASYFFSTGVSADYDVAILPGGSLNLTAPSLTNYEAGARSRLLFTRREDGGLETSLEIAPPGKDFVPYVTGSLKKK